MFEKIRFVIGGVVFTFIILGLLVLLVLCAISIFVQFPYREEVRQIVYWGLGIPLGLFFIVCMGEFAGKMDNRGHK